MKLRWQNFKFNFRFYVYQSLVMKSSLKEVLTNHDPSGVLFFSGALVLVRWHDIDSKKTTKKLNFVRQPTVHTFAGLQNLQQCQVDFSCQITLGKKLDTLNRASNHSSNKQISKLKLCLFKIVLAFVWNCQSFAKTIFLSFQLCQLTIT